MLGQPDMQRLVTQACYVILAERIGPCESRVNSPGGLRLQLYELPLSRDHINIPTPSSVSTALPCQQFCVLLDHADGIATRMQIGLARQVFTS